MSKVALEMFMNVLPPPTQCHLISLIIIKIVVVGPCTVVVWLLINWPTWLHMDE